MDLAKSVRATDLRKMLDLRELRFNRNKQNAGVAKFVRTWPPLLSAACWIVSACPAACYASALAPSAGVRRPQPGADASFWRLKLASQRFGLGLRRH